MDSISHEVLGQAPIFATLADGDRRMIALMMKPKRLGQREVLYRAGEEGDSLAILVEGELQVRLASGDTRVIEPVEVVGELACIDPEPRSATVQSISGALVFQWDREAFMMLRTSSSRVYSQIVHAIAKDVAERLRITNDAIEARYPEHLRSQPFDHAIAAPGRISRASVNLRTVSCLQEFTSSELATLQEASTIVEYGADEVICWEQDEADVAYIIVSGEIEVQKRLGDRDVILGSVDGGNLLGQMALIDDAPRSATLVARGPVVTVQIHRETYQELLTSCTPMAIRLQDLVTIASVRQLRMAVERLHQIPDFAGGSSAQTESKHAFIREDTVKRFLESALLESGYTMSEVDDISFETPSEPIT